MRLLVCMEYHKRDQNITQFYPVRTELYEMNGILMRTDRIILPDKLRLKSVKPGHKLGHLGITKTKQLLRQKCWFTEFNSLVKETIGHCYECQVVTDGRNKEPKKQCRRRVRSVEVMHWTSFIYLGFYVAFNTVQVISRRVVGRAEEASTYRVLYCKLPTSGKQLPAFPLTAMTGSRGGRRECYHSATVAPLDIIQSHNKSHKKYFVT